MKLLSILLFGFALACSQGNGAKDTPVSQTKSYDFLDDEVEGAIVESSELKQDSSPTPEAQDQKVIKTARLSFETKDPEVTHQRIIQLTKDNEGFIQSDNSGKSYGRINKSLIIRVPAENFQKMINGISQGVEYFDQKDISRKDVTEEFVDLQARLKAKRELESRYFELLKQANNVKEMLEIERELSKIREEIEAREGRLQYLQNKVSLGTIYVDFYKTTEIKSATASYGQKMTNALKGGWNGISVFFLGILYIWPLLLLIMIIAFLIRRYFKRQKSKKAKL